MKPITEIQQQLKLSRADRNRLSANLRRTQAECNKLRAEVADLSQKIRDTSELLAEAEKLVAALTVEVSGLRGDAEKPAKKTRRSRKTDTEESNA